MRTKSLSKVPRGSYHWILMTIYDILEYSMHKDFIVTKEVIEKYPILRLLSLSLYHNVGISFGRREYE